MRAVGRAIVTVAIALVVALAATLTLPTSVSAQPQVRPKPGADRLVFAVSEGTSGSQDATDVLARYEDLVNLMSRAIGRKIVFYLARDFASLESGMKDGRLDLIMARPSDYPARGIRDYGYQLVVTTRGDGYVMAIVGKNSTVKTLSDVSGRRIALPQEISYMGRMSRAFLRDNGIDVKKEPALSYHRDQAVIGYAVEQGMVEIGFVASYSGVGRQWAEKGGRVLAAGPPQPYMPIVAGKSIVAAELARLRTALLGLDKSDEGRAILKRMSITGFQERDPSDLLKLLTWLGV